MVFSRTSPPCRPRWAMGRAATQSGTTSGDLEQRFDLDRGAERKLADAHGGAGVAAGVTEEGHDQIRGAVHDGGQRREAGRAVDEAAEAYAALDLVEVTERGLRVGEHV